MRNLLIILFTLFMASCLPRSGGSNLLEDAASEEEVSAMLKLIQQKTGVKAVVSQEGKFLKSDLDRLKPFVDSLKVENKEAFQSVGEILLALGPKGQMVPYQISYLVTQQEIQGKLLLRYSVANIPENETAAQFQGTTLGLATISKELESLFQKLNIGKDAELKTGIDFANPKFTTERVSAIQKRIQALAAAGSSIKQQVTALPFGAETRLSLMLNLEKKYVHGTYYESKFANLATPTNTPRFVADMGNAQSVTTLLKAIPELYKAREQLEKQINSLTGGVNVQMSFGKQIQTVAALQAIARDPAMAQKFPILVKHTEGLKNIFVVDRLKHELPRVDVNKQGVFIGADIFKSNDIPATLGGFVALGKREGQTSKYKLVVSTPGSPSTFRFMAVDEQNKPTTAIAKSDGKGAVKSFEKVFRKAHQTDSFVDIEKNPKVMLEVEYAEKSLVVRQLLSFAKGGSSNPNPNPGSSQQNPPMGQ